MESIVNSIIEKNSQWEKSFTEHSPHSRTAKIAQHLENGDWGDTDTDDLRKLVELCIGMEIPEINVILPPIGTVLKFKHNETEFVAKVKASDSSDDTIKLVDSHGEDKYGWVSIFNYNGDSRISPATREEIEQYVVERIESI